MSALIHTALIGAGGVGAVYAQRLHRALGAEHFCVLAQGERLARYRREGLFVNGERLAASFCAPQALTSPLDCLLIAVKSTALEETIEQIAPCVSPHTLIVSLLNGITSETTLQRRFSRAQVPYAFCVGIDTLHQGNHIDYLSPGRIVFGDTPGGVPEERLHALARLFTQAGIPFTHAADIRHEQMWKWMLNCAVNQLCAVMRMPYGALKHYAPLRDLARAVCREAAAVSARLGTPLDEADVQRVLDTIDTLSDTGQPSMLQDVLAGRPTEVDLFSGAVISLGEQAGVPTPLARMLYAQLCTLQADARAQTPLRLR